VRAANVLAGIKRGNFFCWIQSISKSVLLGDIKHILPPSIVKHARVDARCKVTAAAAFAKSCEQIPEFSRSLYRATVATVKLLD
jgi:hypothetical protein